MLSFDFGVKFRSRVKEKMRRLTSWAVAALLPASMPEEIARMEPRSRGSADSKAAQGRKAPPYQHQAA
jgi:hypothetical protein